MVLLGLAVCGEVAAQTSPRDRVWMAGRYDSTRVIVYFAAVKMGDTLPSDARELEAPRAAGFFAPYELSATHMASLQQTAGVRFKTGDRYDLLVGGGRVIVVTLTQLIGFHSDEQVGNDSYVGALATVARKDLKWLNRFYMVVRPHVARIAMPGKLAKLGDEPQTAGLRRRLIAALRDTLGVDSTHKLAIPDIQTVTLATGKKRYYVRGDLTGPGSCKAVAVWVDAATERRLSIDVGQCAHDPPEVTRRILNVIDVGRKRTVLIVDVPAGDGRSTQLLEYADRTPMSAMRVLQTIAAGE